jgi:hypothetical protein
VKGSANVASSKALKDISFETNGVFQPKLDLIFYGDRKGSADGLINKRLNGRLQIC